MQFCISLYLQLFISLLFDHLSKNFIIYKHNVHISTDLLSVI